MFDIITFGSATWDIFLKPKKFKLLKYKKFITGAGVCFELGSKVEVEKILFSSGGGGTNTAATFAKQEFKVGYCGAVGEDLAGQEIINELDKLGVNTQFVFKTRQKPTNYSVVLWGVASDRTILVYRGASEILSKEQISWQDLKTKWLYLAPLSGKLCAVFEDIVDFAKQNKIKIAVNPGNCQLSLPKDILYKTLKNVDILVLNQEEASLLTKIPYSKEKEIFKKIDKICPGIAIMTKGEKGVVVSDGRYLYRAKPQKQKVVDRTGAGDSFGSGFVSGFIQTGGDIEYAIQLGVANATACLKEVGAKNGLLTKGEEFSKVKIEKELCSKNNLCQVR